MNNITTLFKLILFLFFTLFFTNCKDDFNNYFNNKGWVIDSLYLNNGLNNNNYIVCLKGEVITFRRDGKTTFTPGFIEAIDEGNYEYNEELKAIIFTEIEDCFFRDTFYYEVNYKKPNYLRLQSDELIVICSRISIAPNGQIGPPLYRRWLDKKSWSSKKCQEFRQQVCPDSQGLKSNR